MPNPAFDRFEPLALIGVTKDSIQLLQSLQSATGSKVYAPITIIDATHKNAIAYNCSLAQQVSQLWPKSKALVFCMATGIVTRVTAPLLKDKAQDPAVVVIDATGKYVISLCGGHQAEGDLLTKLIAQQLAATPVITGSSGSLNLPAIDTLGKPFSWQKGTGDWTRVMAAVANSQPVEIMQDAGNSLWLDSLPKEHNFQITNLKTGTNLTDNTDLTHPQARVWISATRRNFNENHPIPKVQWHPRVLWLGIGCERNTSFDLIEKALLTTLHQAHLALAAVAGIATIDLKADESGIIQLCQKYNFPLLTFSAEKLQNITVPTPSEVVKQEVGTPSVAEAAAIVSASTIPSPDNNQESQLLVKKQIHKASEQGAVTVAIAQSATEYTGKTGKLYLVGTGPGSLEQITPAAKSASAEVDVVIGYSLYVDLIRPLIRPQQIVEALPITKEKERGERAIALARWGLSVAVISSGDCGIYGMAGLVMEQLKVTGWDGKTPQVRVFPGISALQATASRVGAPLMHDFCAISLSDLLTPWEVITKRITAAATADFVTAFYNPKSQKRIEQIAQAQSIFLQYRALDTPVAIVKSVYRDDEQITITTLEKMLEAPIDMLTTVIIGNSNTIKHHDWLITPRGYLG